MSYCRSLFPVVRLNIFFTPDRASQISRRCLRNFCENDVEVNVFLPATLSLPPQARFGFSREQQQVGEERGLQRAGGQ